MSATLLEAVQRLSNAQLPSPESEVWRYSRIAELDLAHFRPGAARTEVEGAPADVTVDATNPDIATLVDGMVVHDVFDELQHAHHRTVALRVPAGKVLAEPIVVTHHVEADGVAVFPRLVVMYCIAGAVAGIGGALTAINTGVVGLDSVGFERSAETLIMLILGGAGNLWGALIGAMAAEVGPACIHLRTAVSKIIETGDGMPGGDQALPGRASDLGVGFGVARHQLCLIGQQIERLTNVLFVQLQCHLVVDHDSLEHEK